MPIAHIIYFKFISQQMNFITEHYGYYGYCAMEILRKIRAITVLNIGPSLNKDINIYSGAEKWIKRMFLILPSIVQTIIPIAPLAVLQLPICPV